MIEIITHPLVLLFIISVVYFAASMIDEHRRNQRPPGEDRR